MKINILCFVFGLFIGFFISSLFFQFCNFKEQPLHPRRSPIQLQKEVVSVEKSYGKKYNSLKVQQVKLAEELKGTKSALEKAKQKNLSLHLQVFELLDKHFEQQQNRTNYLPNLLDDSIITVVPDLISAAASKDSLYETVTNNLEQQVRNRDSAIGIKDNQYGDLKKLFGESVAGQTLLQEQNKMLTKTVKRQKVKSKILSAVLLVISGAAANYLIHR